MTTIAETSRLRVREIEVSDAPFTAALLNTPAFLRYIGDRAVRTDAEAAEFIEARYRQAYRDHGYGLWVVESREGAVPMGLCGFVRRESLDGPDLGFAFLPEFEGQGYAHEAATAALHHGRTMLGFGDIFAIAMPDNTRSSRLLERLGFTRGEQRVMPTDGAAVVLWTNSRSAGDGTTPGSPVRVTT